MPIKWLFVEGNLEVEILTRILQETPSNGAAIGDGVTIKLGGSKNSLKPRARMERVENNQVAVYLRDRDFDFDPPADLTKPTIDSRFGTSTDLLGWRWCRHEIENYLIDPVVVGEATGWNVNDFKDALRSRASQIRDYEIARWAIGIARRALPPHFELRTRPNGLSEIGVPAKLSAADVHHWALDCVREHRGRMVAATEPDAIQKTIDKLSEKFDPTFIDNIDNVLIWFAGKDLLAALSEWLAGNGFEHPGAFRAHLRNWIMSNPSRVLQLLPEWDGLVQAVRA